MSEILEDGALGRAVPFTRNAEDALSGPHSDPGGTSSAIVDLRDITYTYEGETSPVINGVSLRVDRANSC